MKGIGKGFAGLDMFGGYSKDSWEMPDNRPKRSPNCLEPETIVCGATNRLVSAIKGVSLEYVKDAVFHIYSGLEGYEKVIGQLEFTEADGMLWIAYEMPPEESARIDPRCDFRYQAKIMLKSGETVYTEMSRCRVSPSLETFIAADTERALEKELEDYEPIAASGE